MSTRRLAMITTVPAPIKKAFRVADPPVSGEERLWRERAARMTLDALGHTNLTVKPEEHNKTARYARRWFRGVYVGAPPTEKVINDVPTKEINDDCPVGTFDAANVTLDAVRQAVLSTDPIIFEPDEED